MFVTLENFNILPSFHFKLTCSQIVVKFHEAFYSMFNHFLVLCAENLESFLICSDCRTPIGFSHHSKCIALSVVKPNIWRKTKYDDKFITYGMKFNFYDIVSPEYRQSIVQKIKKTCWEQQIHARHQLLRTTKSKPFMSKSWPTRWLRGDGDRNRDEKKEHKIVRFQHQQQAMTTTTTTKSSTTTTMMIANLESPPSLESSSSSWTQVQKDIKTLPTTKLEITTFAEQFKLDKLF
jgi:phospholipase C